MFTEQQLKRSKAIQQRTGRTFYLATQRFPRRVREATHVIYAFARVADELVDGPAVGSDGDQREALDDLRRVVLDGAPTEDPVLDAFRRLVEAYDVPREEVELFVGAMASDVEVDRYERYADLRDYMRGSATAVGNLMLAVMAPDDLEAARPHAEALSEALQLTNFLRDVREDRLDLDRVYLPAEFLAAHGTDHGAVERLEPSNATAAAVRDLLAVAEERYRTGVAGIRHLPEDCQFPVLLAATLYAEYHREIRANGYDVLTRRPGLSWRRAVPTYLSLRWHWQRTGDPEAAFFAASAVDRDPDAAEATLDDRRPTPGPAASLAGGSGGD